MQLSVDPVYRSLNAPARPASGHRYRATLLTLGGRWGGGCGAPPEGERTRFEVQGEVRGSCLPRASRRTAAAPYPRTLRRRTAAEPAPADARARPAHHRGTP